MKLRQLGRPGPLVSEIGLGCMGMTFAYSTSGYADDRSVEVIHRALDLGVSLLDTADVYGPYTNEQVVGRALRNKKRDQVVLATKVGLVGERPGHLERNGRPEHIRASIRASLRRLGTDFVDLYQLHRVDPKVPIEESFGAMSELVESGLVRFLGLSEVTVDEIKRAAAIHPVSSIQSELSLWTRDHLAEVVPYCNEHGIGFLAYSPLGRGFLTGAIDTKAEFASDDFRAGNPRFSPEARAANIAIVERIRQVANRYGASPAQVAIAWVLRQGPGVVPIPGTKQVGYLEENVAASELELTSKDMEELDALPAPAGTRY